MRDHKRLLDRLEIHDRCEGRRIEGRAGDNVGLMLRGIDDEAATLTRRQRALGKLESARQGQGPSGAPIALPAGRAEVTLEFVEGMSRTEFARKAQALADLGERGVLFRAANPVPRNRAVTQAYRRDIIDRIWAQYRTRNPEFADRLIDRVTRRMQPDHVHELQLQGPDTASNLRFLDTFTNRHVGSQQIWQQIQNLPVGTEIRVRWSLDE